MTLDKILQKQGFGTRKECQQLILNGQVALAGETVEDYDLFMEPEGLEFSVSGEPWRYREHVYLLLNKPPDVECSRKPSHHPGVLTLLPRPFDVRDVQPVGRLDFDTTGMLLMSDDGAFIHAQSSPKRHVPKTYVATTHDPVTDALVAKLLKGVKLDREPAPLAAQACRQLDSHRIEIVLDQGKYHQVKRMLVAAGSHCVSLTRTAIGGLKLESFGLKEGEWCYLEPEHLALLGATD
jgi:16S rRNA pseudouridine516 synthase